MDCNCIVTLKVNFKARPGRGRNFAGRRNYMRRKKPYLPAEFRGQGFWVPFGWRYSRIAGAFR